MKLRIDLRMKVVTLVRNDPNFGRMVSDLAA